MATILRWLWPFGRDVSLLFAIGLCTIREKCLDKVFTRMVIFEGVVITGILCMAFIWRCYRLIRRNFEAYRQVHDRCLESRDTEPSLRKNIKRAALKLISRIYSSTKSVNDTKACTAHGRVAKQALEMPEILENVLSHVDTLDLLRCLQVSHHFRENVFASPTLRTKLFMRPLKTLDNLHEAVHATGYQAADEEGWHTKGANFLIPKGAEWHPAQNDIELVRQYWLAQFILRLQRAVHGVIFGTPPLESTVNRPPHDCWDVIPDLDGGGLAYWVTCHIRDRAHARSILRRVEEDPTWARMYPFKVGIPVKLGIRYNRIVDNGGVGKKPFFNMRPTKSETSYAEAVTALNACTVGQLWTISAKLVLADEMLCPANAPAGHPRRPEGRTTAAIGIGDFLENRRCIECLNEEELDTIKGDVIYRAWNPQTGTDSVGMGTPPDMFREWPEY